MTANDFFKKIKHHETPVGDLCNMARSLPEEERLKLQELITEECKECQKFFLDVYGAVFNPAKSCARCDYGTIFHAIAEIGTEWKKIDWNSSEYEDYYHG